MNVVTTLLSWETNSLRRMSTYHVGRPSRDDHFYVEVSSKTGSRSNMRASVVLKQAAVWRSILPSRGVLLSPWQVIIWCLPTWWLMPSRVTSDWTWDVRLITESLRYKLRFCEQGGPNESHLELQIRSRVRSDNVTCEICLFACELKFSIRQKKIMLHVIWTLSQVIMSSPL